jgi:Ca2+-transporting ATPase
VSLNDSLPTTDGSTRDRQVTGRAITSFALCLIVAAVECRSETGTALTTATFDSKQMDWAMLGEFVLAVLVTQMDVFNRLLGTVQINLRQFGWALVPAVALLALWELGKLVARSRETAPGDGSGLTSAPA